MASLSGYSMTMIIQKGDEGKSSTLFYRLDDSNRSIDPIVKGWEESGHIVLSISLVRGGRGPE
jgi:hypothetical protein